MIEPLLVVDDVVVMPGGLQLLPAVARAGLAIVAGDAIDLCSDEGRAEVTVLALDPDPRVPSRVRLRIAPTVRAARGVEVWPTEASSRVVSIPPSSDARRGPPTSRTAPAAIGPGQVLRLSGAIGPRRSR